MLQKNDVKIAWFSLLKAPSYAITLILTIGLPIGMLLLAGTLNYHVLLSPLPYPDNHQLIVVKGQLLKDGQLEVDETISFPALQLLYQHAQLDPQTTNETLQAYGSELIENLVAKPYLATSYVTPHYGELLAVPLQYGRFFHVTEGLNSQAPVAIISHQSWRRDFQADPNVLERKLVLNGQAFQIIGVTAAHFQEAKLQGADQASTDIWLPFDFKRLQPADRHNWARTFSGFYLLAKTTGEPALLSQSWSDRLNQQHQLETQSIEQLDRFAIQVEMLTLKAKLSGNTTSLVLLLLCSSFILVAAAGSNAGHLVLTRAARLQPHLAIAAALGANPSQVRGRLLAAQLLLMTGALLLAVATAAALLPFARDLLAPYIIHSGQLRLSWHSLILTLPVLILLMLIFTQLLSRHCQYQRLTACFATGKSGAFQYQSQRVRTLLLVQMALTTFLLVASLQLMYQAISHLQQPLGFQTTKRYLVELHDSEGIPANTTAKIAAWQAIRQHMQVQPDVSTVSITTAPPIHRFGADQWQTNISLDADFQSIHRVNGARIDENFIPLLDIPLLAGRNFSSQEVNSQARVTLINQTLANQLFPTRTLEQIIGQPLYWFNSPDSSQPYTIVGITADLSMPGTTESGRLMIPTVQPSHSVLLVSMQAGTELSTTRINQWLKEVQPQYAVASVLKLERAHQQLLATDIVTATSSATLSLLVSVLTGLGVFGVLNYSVHLRRFELGVRIAIGARPLTILRQLLQENFKPMLAGLALAVVGLTALWLALQKTTWHVQLFLGGFALPFLLIVLLTVLTTLMSVWSIIRQPAIYALQGR